MSISDLRRCYKATTPASSPAEATRALEAAGVARDSITSIMEHDALVISRLLDGDPEVVALVRSWIRMAFAPYRQRLASELEDLEQEILLDLTQALRADRFRGKSRLRTYVRTYVHHKCIDRLRALRRRQWVDIDELELPARTPSAFERLSRTEVVEIGLRVMEKMPESCRELWRMLEQGLRYQEMSRRLGIGEGALRARVFRCRQRALEVRAKLTAAGKSTDGSESA